MVFAQSNLPACQGRDTWLWSLCSGTATWPSGQRYVGEWKNGQANGHGTLIYGEGPFKGHTYIGQFLNNDQSGQGTYTIPNGERYVGEFKNGRYNGQGTYTHLNGERFVGEFKDGKYNGQGAITHPNGEKTVGEFKDGKRNGQGTNTLPSGEKYVGVFKDDKYNGQGTLFASNGSVVNQGIWADGNFVRTEPVQQASVANQAVVLVPVQPNTSQSNLPLCTGAYGVLNTSWSGCFGTHEVSNVGKYSCDRKDGFCDGVGTLVFTDGRKYVGEFKGGMRTGKGVLIDKQGAVISDGIWAENRYVGRVQQFQQVIEPSSEITKLRTEAEDAKRKQIEAEAQLRFSQQTAQPFKPSLSSGTERRVALVIGNATYKVNPLKNPVNDSTDMARSLRSVGFDVIEANNTTLAQMREVTRRFADKLGNSDVGLVYYSGHGVEVKGKNYLIPVNADIKREYEVVDQAFDASQFLEMMDNIRGPNNKRVNILIVDACRNNELQKSWRSTNNGLARMDAPGGTFISFATAPGRVAADGVGRNSPYTKHLLQALKQPNVPIEQVFKVVRRNVMEETKGEQIPWENSSLVGDFYFTVQR